MKVTKVNDGYVVIAARGERLPEVLDRFCEEYGVTAGTVRGIGAIADVELGYFDVDTKSYQRKRYRGSFELLTLQGNISRKPDGDIFIHVHVVLGGPDYRTIGGHLFDATVSVTGEFFIAPVAAPLQRSLDEYTGLSLL